MLTARDQLRDQEECSLFWLMEVTGYLDLVVGATKGGSYRDSVVCFMARDQGVCSLSI